MEFFRLVTSKVIRQLLFFFNLTDRISLKELIIYQIKKYVLDLVHNNQDKTAILDTSFTFVQCFILILYFLSVDQISTKNMTQLY